MSRYIQIVIALSPLFTLCGLTRASAEPIGNIELDAQTGIAVTDPDDDLRTLDEKHQACLIAERSGIPKAHLFALKQRADAELRLGLYVEFLSTTLQALKLAKSLGDVHALSEGLRDLSYAYHLNHQPEKAVDEGRNALAMVLPTKDEQSIIAAQYFLMRRLIDARRFDDVMTLGDKALKRARSHSDAMGVSRIHLLLAGMHIERQAYGEALAHLALAEGMIADRGTNEERQRLLLDMARAQIGMGRTKLARELLDQVEVHLGYEEVEEHITMFASAQYELALKEKNWQEALEHLSKLKTRTDSLSKAQVALQMAGLQVRYQLDKEQQDNERLRDLNSRHTETISIQRSDQALLLIILGCMIALLAGSIFAMRYRMKMMRRMRMKNSVIRRQSVDIHAKNLQLEQQNRRLADALLSEEEKEITIKEIHHRIKNNLQVVDSLLSIQGSVQADPSVDRLFKEAQGRIRSMALVHEHIYRSGGMMEGTMRNHIAQLARSVLTAYGMHDRVSVHVESNEPLYPVDTLMPLTLLVNELLTNAVKHAFVGRERGQIRIKVRRIGEGHELLFTDDGIGLGEHHFLKEESFGLELVNLLAQQLNGEVRIIRGDGVTFSLAFKLEKPIARMAS